MITKKEYISIQRSFKTEFSELNNLPNESGVYAILVKGTCFYVGGSATIRSRLKSNNHPYHHVIKLYGIENVKIKFHLTKEIRRTERSLIFLLSPTLNINGSNSKQCLNQFSFTDKYQTMMQRDYEVLKFICKKLDTTLFPANKMISLNDPKLFTDEILDQISIILNVHKEKLFIKNEFEEIKKLM